MGLGRRAAHTFLGRFPTGLPVIRTPAQTALRWVFGPPPVDALRDPGDPGLFGPGSGSWIVFGQPPGIVGGIRALMIQLMHPLAMAGVADHSRYEDDPLERLRNTARYVAVTAFGSTAEAFEIARDVRRVHTTVRGTAPDGRPYAADDPVLLAWVSIALTSSFLATHQAYGTRRLSRSEADAFVAEQSRAAALLDPRIDLDPILYDADRLETFRRGELDLPMFDDGLLPRTTDQLDVLFDRYRPQLAINDQSARAFRFLLWPSIPAPVRTGYIPLMMGALATIPADLRALVGVPTLGAPEAAVRAQTFVFLTALRALAGRSAALSAAERRVAAIA